MYLGLGVDNEVLDSAEFYDLTADKWTQTSALKVGRTEHVMGLVYGIPTVIGGKDRHYYFSSPFIFTNFGNFLISHLAS